MQDKACVVDKNTCMSGLKWVMVMQDKACVVDKNTRMSGLKWVMVIQDKACVVGKNTPMTHERVYVSRLCLTCHCH